MAKKQPPKEPEEVVDADTPHPWNVEVELFDSEKSVYHAIYKASFDGSRVTFVLQDGQSVSYGFKDVKRVLVMHSVRADYEDSDASKAGE
jgi:hypothetical protein